jgi:hypothetical protein
MNKKGIKYKIVAYDNFHPYDESDCDEGDVFDTCEEAIAAAKEIVDKSLRWEYKTHPGISPEELYEYYQDFGDDPSLRSTPKDPECSWSAWKYAKVRAKDIVRELEGRGENGDISEPTEPVSLGQNPSGLLLILKAAEFASKKHRELKRKGTEETPYINHPISVAVLMAEVAGVDDPEVLAAASREPLYTISVSTLLNGLCPGCSDR